VGHRTAAGPEGSHRPRTAAAGPAPAADHVPAHQNLEGNHRPGRRRETGPDRRGHYPVSSIAVSPSISSGPCRSGPATAHAGFPATIPTGSRLRTSAPTGSVTSAPIAVPNHGMPSTSRLYRCW